MSCQSCRDMLEADGAIPRCQSAEGCLIPPIGAMESRVFELRALIIRLKEVVSPEAVLAISKATMRHLRLLAFIEEAMEEVFVEEMLINSGGVSE